MGKILSRSLGIDPDVGDPIPTFDFITLANMRDGIAQPVQVVGIDITDNGEYEAPPGYAYSPVNVNVQGGGAAPVLIEKTITENGTYSAEDDEADGYSEVTVNVSGGDQQTTIDNIIGNVQFNSFTNTTYSGSNLVLSRIPAINITIENATGLAQSGSFNANTTGIISIPKVTTCGAGAQQSGLKAQVLYAPLMTNLGSNAYVNDCQNLIKLVLATHPIANTGASGSLRNASNLKALVITATSPPALSDAALTRLMSYTGIGTNADGYIYVPTSTYTAYTSATNWSTITSKIRKIEDYPLINAPTTWLPT